MESDDDDYCGCCQTETNYATSYCCTICWKLICTNCIKIFEEGTLYSKPSGYTVCTNNKCLNTHNILNILFNKNIALTIASFHPN